MKSKSNLLIIGTDGYIGSNLYQHFLKRNPYTLGTSRKTNRSLPIVDLESPSLEFLDSLNLHYSTAIICAAVPNILKCQQDPQKTFKQNVLGTLNLVSMLSERGIRPIIFSSDVVFDGKEKSYTEESALNPLNEYGDQKRYLEELAPKINPNTLILRLSKTYSAKSKDSTFLNELALRIINEEKIEAASDLIFNPLLIDDLIDAINLLIEENKSGLYNITSPQSTSWFDLAQKLCIAFKEDPQKVTEVSIDQFSPGAKRAKVLNVLPHRFLKEFPKFTFSTIDDNVAHIKSIHHPTTTSLL